MVYHVVRGLWPVAWAVTYQVDPADKTNDCKSSVRDGGPLVRTPAQYFPRPISGQRPKSVPCRDDGAAVALAQSLLSSSMHGCGAHAPHVLGYCSLVVSMGHDGALPRL